MLPIGPYDYAPRSTVLAFVAAPSSTAFPHADLKDAVTLRTPVSHYHMLPVYDQAQVSDTCSCGDAVQRRSVPLPSSCHGSKHDMKPKKDEPSIQQPRLYTLRTGSSCR